MTITEQDWEQLEAERHARGVTFRRVNPQSAHDIFIAVRHPDSCRMLTLRVPPNGAEEAARQLRALPRTRGLELQLIRLSDDCSELRVVLTDGCLREVFNPLASDIADAAAKVSGAAAAVLSAAERFEHWRRLLDRLDGTGLTAEARRGLFGELAILRARLLPVLASAQAIAAWTGPTGAHQDFQLPRLAIEVKTTSGKEPQTLVISSERELDSSGTAMLMLAGLSLDERRGGTGESLNAAVRSVRAAVTDIAAHSLFDDLLVRVGYLHSQRDLYDEPRYTLRRERFWHVVGDFPRITEADLRPGVGDCRYRIVTAGLEDYLMTEAQVVAAIATGDADE